MMIDDELKDEAAFVQAVRLALATGAHLQARTLSTQGAELYPNHLELQKMARVLAPPRVIDTNVPPVHSAWANRAWLRDHANEYKGQWVALREGTFLMAGAKAREVWGGLESTDDIMLVKII